MSRASSVGHVVSTAHCMSYARKKGDAFFRFQIETSKNFVLRGPWRVISGGLDRHIEHHVFPNLPPTRLHALSDEVRGLCRKHGVRYVEYPSVWASLRDSLSYLRSLSVSVSLRR